MSDTHGIVILGASSVVARAIAIEYALKGYSLILAAPDDEENEAIASDLRIRYGCHVQAIHWDAMDTGTHEAFIATCQDTLGGSLDGIVLCCGYMEDQELGQQDWEIARRTIEINFTGCVSTLNRFANLFEERKSGFIAALSSVAGDRGRQSNYIYGSAKAGLSAYLEGLRNRLHHVGIPVTTIKPGFMDTAMTWGKPGIFLAAEPGAAARTIVRAIDKKKNTVYVPWFWRYIMLIIRHVPEWQFKKMRM